MRFKAFYSLAAHGLYRPTQDRPAADSPSAEPTQRWCSDWGKGRVNVTGKSTRTVRLHPSGHLACDTSDAGHKRSGLTSSHPAEPMEKAKARPNRNWVMFEHEGKLRCLTEIARMVGVKPGTMQMRIARGMTLEQAIQAPDQRRRHQRQINQQKEK
jgi:hypothetical protein